VKIPRVSLSRRWVVFLVICACLLVWVCGRQRVMQMNGRFFQPSDRGILGLAFYMLGDYSRAARAYRSHYAGEVLEQGSLGDPQQDALLLGDHATAVALSQDALKRNPDDVGALLTLGEIAYETGALDQALRLFVEVLDRQPDQIDALLLSSLASARSGDYGSAIELFNRAYRNSWMPPRLTTYLKFMEATGDLAKVREPGKPLCVLAHYYRFFRIYDRSNANLVIAYAKKAIAAGDHPADAYLTMGITYEREGKRAQALSALLKAIELDPRHAYAYRWAAVIYSARGDLANEYRMRKAAADLAPDDPFYALELGEFLQVEMRDYHQALALMQKALEKAPNNIEALARVGSLYASIGEYGRSVEVYQKALSLAPQNPFLYDRIGYPLMELGRIEEATTVYRTAVALKPDLSHAHLMLGTLHQNQRQIPEAIKEYETAFQIQRPEARDLAPLCALYHMSAEYQRAAKCFRQVLSEDPRNRIAHSLLPYVLRNLQQKETQ